VATVITNAGEEWVVDKLKETVQTEANYIGWGEGAGTAAKADTDLFTPVNTDQANTVLRQLGTSSKTGSGATAKYQVVATLTSPNANAKTNAGAWTAVSAGTLVVHGDHTSTAMAIGDQIQYTITIDPS
jgi:lactam utilization protein B